MPDKEIPCRDCKQVFVFPEDEQKFFAEKLMADPQRCKPCRDKHKEDVGRFTDKTLTCVECKQPFLFTAGEQWYYECGASKKLRAPFRCKPCRDRRRLVAAKNEAQASAPTEG